MDTPTILVRVQFVRTLATASDSPPVVWNYRPHFRIESGPLLGVTMFSDEPYFGWGQEIVAEATLVYQGLVDYSRLVPGVEFSILEGPYVVGFGVVIRGNI